MSQEQAKSAHPEKGEHATVRVCLPGFISDEEAGLGDVIKRVTSSSLNRWVRFTGRAK